MKFEELVLKASNEELNTRIHKCWKNKQGDGKKLWKAIEWKGGAEAKPEKPAHETDTIKYFTSIFQAAETKKHPAVTDVIEDLNQYEMYIPILDNPPTMEELDLALLKIGSGVSLDGIPPNVSKFLPKSIKEVILKLMQDVFYGEYPNEWTKQILHSIKKMVIHKKKKTPGNSYCSVFV